MKQRSKSIGLLIELIVSILVFSISCAILLQIFFSAKKSSANAYKSTQALSCAQSLADQFRVEGSMALALQTAPGGAVVELEENTYVFFFDDAFAPCAEAQSAYRATVAVREQQFRGGTMCSAEIAVCAQSEEPLCSLEAKKYLPGGVSE